MSALGQKRTSAISAALKLRHARNAIVLTRPSHSRLRGTCLPLRRRYFTLPLTVLTLRLLVISLAKREAHAALDQFR